MKKIITFIIIIILTGCVPKSKMEPSKSTSVSQESSIVSKSKKCYVFTNTKDTSQETLLTNISVSLISQYVTQVSKPPFGGLREDDSNCVYEVSFEKQGDTLFTTISGEKLNSYGDSKLTGGDGIQQSILKGMFRSLKKKRGEICNDYRDILEECKKIEISFSGDITWSKGVTSTGYSGKFDYSLSGGGDQDKVNTIFRIEDNKFVGIYHFKYKNKVEKGVIRPITKKQIVNKNQLNIDWFDDYGDGQIHMKTTNDWKSFKGEWYFKGKIQGLWSGTNTFMEESLIKLFIDYNLNK